MDLLQFYIFIGMWRMNECIYYTLFVLFNTEIGISEQSWELTKFRALILGMLVNF
jgi:hypothetical protein